MNESSPLPADFVLLDIHEVRKKVGLGTSTIYRMMKDEEFPTSVSLAPRTVRWLSHEVDAWVAEKVAATRSCVDAKARASVELPADPTDPEDFDVSAEGISQGLRARSVRLTRTKLDLSQLEFAARFRIPAADLREWEAAREPVPDVVMAYYRVIERHPDLVATAVA